jgi:hypothetical protein
MAKLGGRHGKHPYVKYASDNGWEIERRNGGHLVARKTDEQGQSHLLFIGGTPGGGRATQNTLAKFVKCDKGRCHCHLRHAALSAAG